MFKKLQKLLFGYKVYMVAIMAIIKLLVDFASDVINAGELVNGIILALGAMAGRAALKKKGTLA
ncbi:hypothetical protein ACFL4H_00010 [Candidatus Neomarinimicrobiota bacterium]